MAVDIDIKDAINDEELAQETKPPTRTPRARPSTRIPAQKGEADVQTTIKYRAPLEDVSYDNETINGARPFTPSNNQSSFQNAYPQTNQGNAPTNRLADMFAELAEYQQYDEQQFLCFLVRRADYANDRYRRRLLVPENFQPFPITVKSIVDLISTIQEINGNSGGRFDIRILDENGADTEIGIAGFVISDPPEKAIPAVSSNGAPSSEINAILDAMKEQQRQSDERFNKLFEIVSKPKEDALMEILKQKMVNDILNPAPPRDSEFSTEKFLATIMTAPVMVQTMSEKMAQAMDGNKNNNESIVERLLGNELLMSTAKETVNKIVTAAENVIVATQQRNTAQNGAVPQPPPPADGYPPLNAQQQTVTVEPEPTPEEIAQAEKEAADSMQMLSEIITELESDNAITKENETFVKISTAYPKIYKQLEDACKMLPFDTILTYLEDTAPDTFTPFYVDPDAEELEFNERGQKIEKRLEELYSLLRG